MLPNTETENTADEANKNPLDAELQISVPVKFNKEIRNLSVEEASNLAQKGLKFETIEENYGRLKELAANNRQSVSEFLLALKEAEKNKRVKELSDKCGGNEEMAMYVLNLENGRDNDLGFEELQTEFPVIKKLSDLPEEVVEKAKLKGSYLLDEYLRYRLKNKKAVKFEDDAEKSADFSSIGSQLDRRGGTDPAAEEFLKGLWK